MKKSTHVPQYSLSLAADLSTLAKQLGIPKKFIHLWRQEWLSYPVTPEQFQTLIIIATHIWCVDTCIKGQLARKSIADRLRLINDAGESKPLSYCRNVILKRMLEGSPSLPAKVLKDRVRCFYPNGYVAVTPKTIRAARAWARRQYIKASSNAAYRENLVRSLENVEVDL